MKMLLELPKYGCPSWEGLPAVPGDKAPPSMNFTVPTWFNGSHIPRSPVAITVLNG